MPYCELISKSHQRKFPDSAMLLTQSIFLTLLYTETQSSLQNNLWERASTCRSHLKNAKLNWIKHQKARFWRKMSKNKPNHHIFFFKKKEKSKHKPTNSLPKLLPTDLQGSSRITWLDSRRIEREQERGRRGEREMPQRKL